MAGYGRISPDPRIRRNLCQMGAQPLSQPDRPRVANRSPAMTRIQWDAAWETGIPAIDKQHKQLVDHVGRLLDAIMDGQTEIDIENSLFFLAQYTDFHFRDEEEIMAETRYPALAEHRARHTEMREQVAEMVRTHVREPQALTVELVRYMHNWIINHVGTMDKALAAYLKQQGHITLQ